MANRSDKLPWNFPTKWPTCTTSFSLKFLEISTGEELRGFQFPRYHCAKTLMLLFLLYTWSQWEDPTAKFSNYIYPNWNSVNWVFCDINSRALDLAFYIDNFPASIICSSSRFSLTKRRNFYCETVFAANKSRVRSWFPEIRVRVSRWIEKRGVR